MPIDASGHDEMRRRLSEVKVDVYGERAKPITPSTLLDRLATELFDAVLLDCQMPVMDGGGGVVIRLH